MNRKYFIIIWLLWFIIIWWFIFYKEYTNIFGESIYLNSAPVDPNDIFRWDYVILSYDISRFECSWDIWTTIYVSLVNSWGIWYANGCSNTKPQNWIFIKGKKDQNNQRNKFGIEKYFVQEWKGMEIESHVWKMLVEVKIDNFGNALVKWFKFE